MELRFGITMRITHANNYCEPRDTIAQDWSRYILKAFPNSKFLFIPNIENSVIHFIEKWDINVLIISGGEDLGSNPVRDITEQKLLNYALKFKMATIAICRGMQLVHTYFGGQLINGNKSFIVNHRATQHSIIIGDESRVVNSYHNNKLDKESLNNEAKILAYCEKDRSIEAIEIKNILAMMWHPERDMEISKWNISLIHEFIQKVNGY